MSFGGGCSSRLRIWSNSIPRIFGDLNLNPKSHVKYADDLEVFSTQNSPEAAANQLNADLDLVGTNHTVSDFENKISNYDEKSEGFINYLIEIESQYSTLDILSNIDLIPSPSEIEDPISWAARTSLPPI